MRFFCCSLLLVFYTSMTLLAQSHGHDHHNHDHSQGGHHHHDQGHDHSSHAHQGHDHNGHADEDHHHANACGFESHHGFDASKTAFHHISDQNVYNIGSLQIPLPCMLYVPGKGFDFFSSGRFDADYHGNGRKAYNGFVLHNGTVRRVLDPSFPMGEVVIGDHATTAIEETNAKGKKIDKIFLCHDGKKLACDSKSTLDGGLFGGGLTSFYDFSITKNVMTMFIVFLFLTWLFLSVAKAYRQREGKAPTGLQGFMETMFVFIQDEVAKPFLGHKWEKFLPLLMALFFFILGLNLFGQIPFFGGSNVTGNLSVTLVLAVITFIVTTINGNSHYWGHVLNMPGVPWPIKILVVTPVEIMGLFIKPLTLMLRLFGNITAGHMVIVIFVSLIFIFGNAGMNPVAGWGMVIPSALLTLFMMAIELLVAFIQAFVFTILTASYIGAAIEEEHH